MLEEFRIFIVLLSENGILLQNFYSYDAMGTIALFKKARR